MIALLEEILAHLEVGNQLIPYILMLILTQDPSSALFLVLLARYWQKLRDITKKSLFSVCPNNQIDGLT